MSLAATFGEFRIHLRYLELLADSLSGDRPNDGPVKPLLAWRNELNTGQDHRREQLWNALGAATRDRKRLLDRHRQLLADIER